MQNVSDLIWNDQSTMERVCKIIEGIWNGIVFFGNEVKDISFVRLENIGFISIMEIYMLLKLHQKISKGV